MVLIILFDFYGSSEKKDLRWCLMIMIYNAYEYLEAYDHNVLGHQSDPW